MHYGNIKRVDIANGTGVRVSLFVSGCTRRCKGCFNKETWDFSFGRPYTRETENEIITLLKPDYIDGLSILGGEPFEPQNQKELAGLVSTVKRIYPKKTIWCYTGYTLETDLLSESRVRTEYTDIMLKHIDILVDGEFIEEQKNINLLFKGSENQRIINLPVSLKEKRIVLWEPHDIHM